MHTAPDEHLVLIRLLARLQERMSLLAADARASLYRQDAEIVRLRGELLVARTAAWWAGQAAAG